MFQKPGAKDSQDVKWWEVHQRRLPRKVTVHRLESVTSCSIGYITEGLRRFPHTTSKASSTHSLICFQYLKIPLLRMLKIKIQKQPRCPGLWHLPGHTLLTGGQTVPTDDNFPFQDPLAQLMRRARFQSMQQCR